MIRFCLFNGLLGGKQEYLEEIVRKCHGSERQDFQQEQQPLQFPALEQQSLYQRNQKRGINNR